MGITLCTIKWIETLLGTLDLKTIGPNLFMIPFAADSDRGKHLSSALQALEISYTIFLIGGLKNCIRYGVN